MRAGERGNSGGGAGPGEMNGKSAIFMAGFKGLGPNIFC